MDILVTILAFLLIIGALVFVHELGHFWVARRNGIKVEEFAFGLPLLPRIYSKRRGETTYSIYPVPIGGFVRMLGEDGKSKSKRSFAAQTAGVRAKVLVAGVAMNALVAYLLLTAGFLGGMQPLALCASDYPNATYRNDIRIAAVAPDSPASRAGLKRGDVVQTVAGERIGCSKEIPRLTAAHAGEPTAFGIVRSGTPQTLIAAPGTSGAFAGKVGIAPEDRYSELDYPKWEAPYIALLETVAIISATLTAVVGLFATVLTQGSVPAGISGPVGIAKVTGDIIGLGGVVLLRFVAVISLSLAIFNLLPIPALDGGRLLFVGIEKLRRGKPVPAHIEQYFHLAGFVFLIGLILFITYFDIIR
ncbi:MAG: site-2 protease family protein [bacterium]|nr:site-2 protease family protein [bacterium]MDZ4248128.1 site-2 protease family protein [Patescibacteria group bacterium]